MLIKIPSLSLVVLIGPSGSGKSTFARRHFFPSEVLSSDFFRGLVSDDENDQSATKDAFDVLHFVAAKRLARGRLTVIDATNVQPEARKPLVELARRYHCLPVAIVLNPPEKVCHERNRERDDRLFGPHVVRQQRSQLRRSLRGLKREGFRHIFVMESVEEIDAASMERVPLWNDRRAEHGPLDIIGDVHGCADELEDLLGRLGYERISIDADPLWGDVLYRHPEGRKAVFVGDLVDRGPRVLDAARIVRNMVQCGSGLCVPGNHDMKLLRKLRGKNVQITHGLAQSLGEIEALPEDMQRPFCTSLADFLDGLVSHYVFDDRKLVVAHAGMKEEMQGRGSGKVREFALYGETTGETDEFGLPVRYNWARIPRPGNGRLRPHTRPRAGVAESPLGYTFVGVLCDRLRAVVREESPLGPIEQRMVFVGHAQIPPLVDLVLGQHTGVDQRADDALDGSTSKTKLFADHLVSVIAGPLVRDEGTDVGGQQAFSERDVMLATQEVH